MKEHSHRHFIVNTKRRDKLKLKGGRRTSRRLGFKVERPEQVPVGWLDGFAAGLGQRLKVGEVERNGEWRTAASRREVEESFTPRWVFGGLGLAAKVDGRVHEVSAKSRDGGCMAGAC